MNDKAFIWWCQVSNAVRVLNSISEYLIAEKSAALFFPKHVPWYDFFSNTIRERLHCTNSRSKPDIIDVSGENIRTVDDVGKFIAHKYCCKNKLDEYWPGESYAQFLAESNDIILNNTYVWVRGISKDNFQAWCSFVEEYESHCSCLEKHAVFLLEYFEDGEKSVFNYKNLNVICWEREIKSYDYYMFCSLLVSDLKCSDEVKHYIAELAYLLGECNAEFCAFLTENRENFAENPIEILERCAEEFRYGDGAKIELVNRYTAKFTVLEAQIKNVFPIIERYRIHFITDNYYQIKSLLPIENNIGEEIKEPFDVEIGGLRYMEQNCGLQKDLSKWNDLKFFHDSRNKIAHNTIISYQEVKRILSRFSDN